MHDSEVTIYDVAKTIARLKQEQTRQRELALERFMRRSISMAYSEENELCNLGMVDRGGES